MATPTGRRVLGIYHRVSSLHHGGDMAFGPDGKLWLGTGDGGYSPFAQDPLSLSGKFLRLDPAAAAPRPEVMALGLRNPYRWSFHGSRILVGDVGDLTEEEADVLSPNATAPPNGGWPVCEGHVRETSPGQCPGVANYVPPFLTYRHPPCAITGGHVVTDLALPGLDGRWLYTDYCRGELNSAQVEGAAADVRDTGLKVVFPVAFAQDRTCRSYVVSLAGAVYRLDSTDPRAPKHGCPVPLRLTGLSLTRVRGRAGVGVTLHLSVSRAATVSVRLYRALAGHRRGAHCVAGAGERHCVRFSNVIQRVRRLSAGRRAIALPRALGPGTYRVTVRANDAAGDAATSRALSLRVLPPPR